MAGVTVPSMSLRSKGPTSVLPRLHHPRGAGGLEGCSLVGASTWGLGGTHSHGTAPKHTPQVPSVSHEGGVSLLPLLTSYVQELDLEPDNPGL